MALQEDDYKNINNSSKVSTSMHKMGVFEVRSIGCHRPYDGTRRLLCYFYGRCGLYIFVAPQGEWLKFPMIWNQFSVCFFGVKSGVMDKTVCSKRKWMGRIAAVSENEKHQLLRFTNA
nr:hypothetical protein [Tanacetum cinerariifolium]